MAVKVECESCKAPYTIDERRIPASGLRVRCPKCAKTFVIRKPADGGAAPTASAAPAAAPTAPAAPVAPAAPPSSPAAKPEAKAVAQPAPPAATKAKDEDDADLPAPAAAAALPAVRAGAPPARRAPGAIAFSGAPGGSQAKPSAATPPQAPPTARAAADLPATKAPDNLPATKAGAKPPLKPFAKGTQLGLGGFVPKTATAAPKEETASAKQQDLPATRAPKQLGEVALPAAKGGAARPTKGGDAFADLPSPTGARADLPAQKRGVDLPAQRRPGVGEVDLPVVASKGDLPARKMDFGELDLPAVGGPGLPAVQEAGLPTLAGVGLPAVSGAVGLPAVQQTGRGSVDLPTATGNVAHLPAVANPGAHLPAVASPGGNLPSVASHAAHLPAIPAPERSPDPMEMDPFAEPPPAMDPFADRDDVSVAQTMAGPGYKPPQHGAASGGFGDVDIPGPGDLGGGGGFDIEAPQKARAPAGGFGDVDIPAPPAHEGFGQSPQAQTFGGGKDAPGPLMLDATAETAPGAPGPSREDKIGGMGFGEVELPGGGGSNADDDMEFGAIPQAGPAASPGAGDIPEAPHEYEAPLPRPAENRTGAPIQSEPKKKSVVGWVFLGLFIAAVLGGAALETTKYGAFGRNYITDRLNADKYAATTTTAMKRTRAAFADDSAPSAAAAITQLDADVQTAPRHQPLLAYVAYANFADEIRFGKDGQLDSKGKRLVGQVVDALPYKKLAEAARDVVAGQFPGARATLQSLLSGDTQLDAAVTLGELELRDKKPKEAIAAFQTAKKAEESARTRAGLMRAYDAAGDVENAKKEAAAIAEKYPKHVPSRLLLARYAWDKKDEKETLKWLDEIKKPEVQANAAPAEVVEALTLRGNVLLDRGRVNDARAAFDQAVKSASGVAAPLAELGLGEVDMASGQYATAIAHFNTAATAQPDLTDAKIGIARAKLKQELPIDAKAVLSTLKDPKKAGEIGFWLGQAQEKLEPDKPNEAMKTYQDAIKAQPSEVKAYIALARLQSKVGKPDEADATLVQALKAVPPTDKLYVAVGQLKYQQGKYEDALAQFESALKIQPDNLEALFEKGRTLLRMTKRMDEGKAVLDDVEKKDAKYPGLALEFGYYYLHTNQVAEALKRYQSALDAAPNDADVKLNVGIAMVESGNPDAEQTLRDVLDKCGSQSASPDSCLLEAKHYLGRALLLKGTPADAQVFLKQAVEKGDANAAYHLYYGQALFELGRYDEADQEINRSLELDKSKADAYWLRGEILSRRSQFKDAIAEANNALKQNANLFKAHATIAYSLHELGNDGEAIGEYRKAIEGDPTNPKAAWWRYEIADIMYHSGGIAGAVKDLQASIDAASAQTQAPPWLPKALFYLGEALRHSDKQGAIKAYKDFLTRTVGSTDPARGDAKAALVELGAPYGGP